MCIGFLVEEQPRVSQVNVDPIWAVQNIANASFLDLAGKTRNKTTTDLLDYLIDGLDAILQLIVGE